MVFWMYSDGKTGNWRFAKNDEQNTIEEDYQKWILTRTSSGRNYHCFGDETSTAIDFESFQVRSVSKSRTTQNEDGFILMRVSGATFKTKPQINGGFILVPVSEGYFP